MVIFIDKTLDFKIIKNVSKNNSNIKRVFTGVYLNCKIMRMLWYEMFTTPLNL